jgi:hypothetical protein
MTTLQILSLMPLPMFIGLWIWLIKDESIFDSSPDYGCGFILLTFLWFVFLIFSFSI